MVPFLLVLIESDKIFHSAIHCHLNFDFKGYGEKMILYRLFLSACGYSEHEFDLKLIEWIDSQWHDIAYNYHGRNRFSYWN
jgi:hypothetical protein